MSDQGPRGDRGCGVPRRAAEQHPRSAEQRPPGRSPRCTSKLTSHSTITYKRFCCRRRHAGESSEICVSATTPGCSATHVGVPWPKSSNVAVRSPDPPSGGVRGEGADRRTHCARLMPGGHGSTEATSRRYRSCAKRSMRGLSASIDLGQTKRPNRWTGPAIDPGSRSTRAPCRP